MRRLVIKNSYGLEIWTPINGFEDYQVSTIGRVKNKHGRFMEGSPDKDGYIRVALTKDKKKYFRSIHSLVGNAWLPSHTKEAFQINHKDENKHNNRVENLEFCTPLYNNTYGTRIERIFGKKN